jgi:cellobiose transport system permease protein
MSSVAVAAQTAGPGAARAAARRRSRRSSNGYGTTRRPGWVTYVLLGITILISLFPIYFTLILGSSTPEEISRSAVPINGFT